METPWCHVVLPEGFQLDHRWLDALQEDKRIEVLEINRTSAPRSPAPPMLERAGLLVELLEQHGLTADVNALAGLIRTKEPPSESAS